MRLLRGPLRHQAEGAAGPPLKLHPIPHVWPPSHLVILICLLVAACATNTYGGCEFPSHWSGRWFQNGVGILQLNRTSIETKGECYESQGDKFMIYDRSENCYRCMVIHEKHYSVLQYKETSYCDQKTSLSEMCNYITGDAPLYSMFRKFPEPKPVPCPFKQAPFTFSYNRGSGECSNPPSRAESCTDDSRLVLKYQACPDIQSTESNIEELVCVATWKEGSTRYLVGKLNQVSRRSAVASDEDQYRCFIYERAAISSGGNGGNRVTYHVAQSGDATCNGLQSAVEGSRMIRLTTADSHHGRCRFPSWITDHHTWFNLDHSQTYKFTLRNATLTITTSPGMQGGGPVVSPVAASTDRDAIGVSGQGSSHLNRHHAHDLGSNPINLDSSQKHHSNLNPASSQASGSSGGDSHRSGGSSQAGGSNVEDDYEVRVVCHSILQSIENRRVQIVAHVTAGCDSGYICMVFHKRDSSVIEIQQSEELHENTDDACRYFDPISTKYTTLIAPSLHPTRCPHPGRYTVIGGAKNSNLQNSGDGGNSGSSVGGKRKKRRQINEVGHGITNSGQGPDVGADNGVPTPVECLSHDYEGLAVGCSSAAHDTLEFRSPCPHQPISAYTCHGSWQENNTYYVIASPVARKSTDALRYCLVYTFDGENSTNILNNPSHGYNSVNSNNYYGKSSGVAGTAGAANFGPQTGPPNGMVPSGIPVSHGMMFSPQSGMIMRLSGLSDSCHRHITPGSSGLWAFNFTTNGACTRSGDTGGAVPTRGPLPFVVFLLMTTLPLLVMIRPFR